MYSLYRYTFTQLVTESSYDELKFSDFTTGSARELFQLAGSTSVFTIFPIVAYTNGERVKMQFKTDGSIIFRGFIFTYTYESVFYYWRCRSCATSTTTVRQSTSEFQNPCTSFGEQAVS